MLHELICKNCGAPLCSTSLKCAYCGTEYKYTEKSMDCSTEGWNDITTPNEMRQMLNLKQETLTILNEIAIDEIYNSALRALSI